jgi:DNA-binding CsgD family transcriptional regulator
MLVGRRAETEALDRLLVGAREGRSGVLVLRGEAGIGKTALLNYVEGQTTGASVLRSVGIESETDLAFAGLHQLFRPVLDRIERLPERQAGALRAAFALSNETVEDRFHVALGALALLCEVAEEKPLVCLVDDAQWLDGASTEALLFAARRLGAEPLAIVLAVREEPARPFTAPGIDELVLAELPDQDARALAAQRLPRDTAPEALDRLLETAQGNPLALIELATGETPEGELPTTSVEETYLERIRSLPDPAQSMLVVAAAEESGDRATIVRAAGVLGLDDEGLAKAEAAGLVRVNAQRVDFRHPLVRSAAYRGAGFAERERAHRALADVLTGAADADRRAWHRAAATVGTDDGVAAELEQTANRARQRGGHESASAALTRAAELSSADEERGRRLVAAAVEASVAGRSDQAVALAERAALVSNEPLGRAEAARVRGLAELQRGTPSTGLRIFLAGARELPEGGSEKALEMLVYAAESASLAGDAGGMRAVSEAASRLSVGQDDRASFLLRFLSGLGPFSEGDAAGSALLEEAVVLGERSDDAQRVFWASAAAAFMGNLERASALAGRAATLARQRGEVTLVAHALSSCAAYLLVENRFAEAAADATEAVRLGREIGAENLTGLPLGVLAMVAAVRGREDEARELADEVMGFARERGLALPSAFAVWALASVDLAHGRWARALEHYDALSDVRPGFGHRLAAILTVPDRMETLVRLGRPEEAIEALPAFEAWAAHAGASGKSRLASCRALVGSGAEATAYYEEAVRETEVSRPFDLAHIRLLYGEHLRRERRRLDAREQLRSALEEFERLGAAPWAERARSELRATGETARRRDPSTIDSLTPQELQIARLVGEGASNKEVAAQLFLSPRTVEYHLRKVFQKLGIASRAELIRHGLGTELAPTPV